MAPTSSIPTIVTSGIGTTPTAIPAIPSAPIGTTTSSLPTTGVPVPITTSSGISAIASAALGTSATSLPTTGTAALGTTATSIAAIATSTLGTTPVAIPGVSATSIGNVSIPITATATSSLPSTAVPIAIPSAPKVSGTGIDASLFTNLTNAVSANSLLTQLSSQNLGSIASSISQTQMTELVSKFGTDAGFQTLLSTGTIPASALASAPTAAPSVPKVSGTGIDTSFFTSLANSATASSLLTQLSTQNLGTIASTISQSQLSQLVAKFGADPAFQTLLSTGAIPVSAIAAVVTTALPKVPTVSGTGIDASLFTNLANSTTASSLLTLLSTQNLGTIASSISQSQLAQLVSKFGSDPNFQTLLATGSIPASALGSTNKALLINSAVHAESSSVKNIDLQLVGTANEFLATN